MKSAASCLQSALRARNPQCLFGGPEIGRDLDDPLFPCHRFAALQILKQSGQGLGRRADSRSQLLLIDLNLDFLLLPVLFYQECAQPLFDILARQLLDLIRKVALFAQQHRDEIIPEILLAKQVQQVAAQELEYEDVRQGDSRYGVKSLLKQDHLREHFPGLDHFDYGFVPILRKLVQ